MMTEIRSFTNQAAYRAIPSKYPPIDLYEQASSAEELEAIYALEALTNPRLLEMAGDLQQVPKEDWCVGIPHNSFVMAAFTYVNPVGGRFTTHDFGAYYCAREKETAIKETTYHIEQFMSYTSEPPQSINMRLLASTFNADLVDITDPESLKSALYNANDYSASQSFAIKHRTEGKDGIIYRSIRHFGGECYALFKPKLITAVCQSEHYDYKWNGNCITNVTKMSLEW